MINSPAVATFCSDFMTEKDCLVQEYFILLRYHRFSVEWYDSLIIYVLLVVDVFCCFCLKTATATAIPFIVNINRTLIYTIRLFSKFQRAFCFSYGQNTENIVYKHE